MKSTKIVSIVLAAVVAVCLLCSCTTADVKLNDYGGKEYHVTSDKSALFDSINELNKRLLRYDDDTAIGDIKLPEGATFNMGWQTASLVWHNATEEAVNEDI